MEEYVKSPHYYESKILSMMTDNDIHNIISDKIREKKGLDNDCKYKVKGLKGDNRKILLSLYEDYIKEVQNIINKFKYILKSRRGETDNIDLNELKQRISLTDVMFAFGVKVRNAKHNIKCPFPDHKDSTPSFKIYGNNFHCFGCHKSGTQIDFIMGMTGYSLKEAIKKFKDFN